jgi:hypothetical protein
MVISSEHMPKLASEALAERRRICATSDALLTPDELAIKREDEAELARLQKKFGAEFDRVFG